jgi:transposase
MWYAGIDWADRHHDAVVIDAAGRRVAALRVDHSAAGLAKLTDFLRDIGDVAQHPDHLACIVETSRGLLITALLEAGLPVYPVNPRTVDQRRKPSGAKTDAIDAYPLARTGRSDLPDLRRLVPDGPLVAELRLLTRDLEGLIQGQTRLLNRLTACLKAYYPAALALFSTLHRKCQNSVHGRQNSGESYQKWGTDRFVVPSWAGDRLLLAAISHQVGKIKTAIVA